MEIKPSDRDLGVTSLAKHKSFGAAKSDKKHKDFMASATLNPGMKANGFIMDKYLSKVGKMLE